MIHSGLLLSVLCCLLPYGNAQTLYKCVDASEHVTYQDEPCADNTATQQTYQFNTAQDAVPPALPTSPPVIEASQPPPPPPPTDFGAIAARKYAREQAARALRNCQIMDTCPTPMDRLQRQNLYLPPPDPYAPPAALDPYTREQVETTLRNCRIMKTCPTALDRVLVLQRFGLATDVHVQQCARHRSAVYCLGQ
jgi:hypothetical protein